MHPPPPGELPAAGRTHPPSGEAEHKAKISKKVYAYSNYDLDTLLFTFISQKDAAVYFKSSESTISRYLDNKNLYKDQWVLSSFPISKI
jgi:hypothetical protein